MATGRSSSIYWKPSLPGVEPAPTKSLSQNPDRSRKRAARSTGWRGRRLVGREGRPDLDRSESGRRDRGGSRPPEAEPLDHPLRAELSKVENGFQPAAVGFLDMAALEPLSSGMVGLGLDSLKRIELRWGFQDDALLSVLRLVAPEPRRGMLALLDQTTFRLDSLPPIPADVSGFTVMSIDLPRTYDQVDLLIKQADPDAKVGLTNPAVLAQRGLDLRRDFLAHLGPLIALYTQAPIREESRNAAELLASRIAGYHGFGSAS